MFAEADGIAKEEDPPQPCLKNAVRGDMAGIVTTAVGLECASSRMAKTSWDGCNNGEFLWGQICKGDLRLECRVAFAN